MFYVPPPSPNLIFSDGLFISLGEKEKNISQVKCHQTLQKQKNTASLKKKAGKLT